VKTINEQWHKKHPMPEHPTVEERISWHRAHQEYCACRPIPESLRDRMGSAEPRRARGKPRNRPTA
jgi:hypothetical protein